MSEDGIVGPYAGSKTREVVMTMEDWNRLKNAVSQPSDEHHSRHVADADDWSDEAMDDDDEEQVEEEVAGTRLAAENVDKDTTRSGKEALATLPLRLLKGTTKRDLAKNAGEDDEDEEDEIEDDQEVDIEDEDEDDEVEDEVEFASTPDAFGDGDDADEISGGADIEAGDDDGVTEDGYEEVNDGEANEDHIDDQEVDDGEVDDEEIDDVDDFEGDEYEYEYVEVDVDDEIPDGEYEDEEYEYVYDDADDEYEEEEDLEAESA
jgi:hypothetical protein